MSGSLPMTLGPLHTVCGPFCHQIAERSIVADGVQFPLCWRCAGLWLGFAAGVLVFRSLQRAAYPRPRVAAAAAVALLTPLMIDGVAVTLGLWATPGPARAATGSLLGVGIMWVLSLLSPVRRDGRSPVWSIAAALGIAASALGLAAAGVGMTAIGWAAVAGWAGMAAVLASAAWRTIARSAGADRSLPVGGAA